MVLLSFYACYYLLALGDLSICTCYLAGNLGLLDLSGNNWDCQPTHGLAEIQLAGRPVLILSSLPASDAPYDDDP